MTRYVATGIWQAPNGLLHFAPSRIAAAARALGATDADADRLCETLLGAAYDADTLGDDAVERKRAAAGVRR